MGMHQTLAEGGQGTRNPQLERGYWRGGRLAEGPEQPAGTSGCHMETARAGIVSITITATVY